MAVKPSAITGTGTENNPYVIHNYNELKWCCEDADAVPEGQAKTDYVYVKLNNDIDCSTYGMSFRWFITCEHAIDLNLNNKTIENFYIEADRYMFNVSTTARKLIIHDGKILNVYGDWVYKSYSFLRIMQNTADALLSLKNISLSIDVSNFLNVGSILCSTYSQRMIMTNCTIDARGSATTATALVANAQLFTCDIHVDIISSYTVVYLIGGSSSSMGYALNCRFMGQIQLNNITSASYCTNYTTIRNCVIDVTVSSTVSSTATLLFAHGPGQADVNYGIYNADKLPNYSFSNTNYIACTTADMDMRVNPNADIVLQEKGFDVIKG